MYVYLKYCDNWTTNIGDMAKVYFSLLSFLFFSLNLSISKTLQDAGLKFCTQVGSDDPMCSNLNVVSNVESHSRNKGDTLYITGHYMAIKLCPSTNPITTIFTNGKQ